MFFFFQAEDGIRDLVRSRGLGDVYKRQRRSRVRNSDTIAFDIHDRVNYAVESSKVVLDMVAKTVTLRLTINTDICSVIDYFEIFLNRMLLCRKSADVLGLHFKLNVNGQDLI